jgi:hypothetical protein
MAEVARAGLWKALKLYFVSGILLGGVKLASLCTWLLAASLGQVGANYVAGDFFGILLLSVIGVALAIIAWPIVFYNVLIGTASLPAVLFFPWVTTL